MRSIFLEKRSSSLFILLVIWIYFKQMHGVHVSAPPTINISIKLRVMGEKKWEKYLTRTGWCLRVSVYFKRAQNGGRDVLHLHMLCNLRAMFIPKGDFIIAISCMMHFYFLSTFSISSFYWDTSTSHKVWEKKKKKMSVTQARSHRLSLNYEKKNVDVWCKCKSRHIK